MNQRIKELATEAGLQPFEDCGPGYVYKMEKFAELIVKECAKLITEDNPHTCYREIRDDRKIQAMRIKLEFGVE